MMMIDARRGSAVWPKRADSGILMPVVSGLIVVGVALLAAAGVVVLEQLVPAARSQAHNEDLVKKYTTTVIDTEWPLLARHQASSQAWAVFTQLRELVSDQQPTAPAAVARHQ
jgi:hypothetical protein